MQRVSIENRVQLGQFLIAQGAVTSEQVQDALQEQRETGHQRLLGEILVSKKYCDEEQIAMALAQSYGVPFAKVSPRLCDPKVFDTLPREFLDEHVVLPLFRVQNILTIALSEPANLFLIDQIEQISGYKVQVVCTTDKDIKATIQAYSPTENVFIMDDIPEEAEQETLEIVEKNTRDAGFLKAAGSQTSVIQLVNHVLCEAVKCNASDVHIEPDESSLRIRFRIDGRLYEKMKPPHQMHAALVSRIRMMAELDIMQRQTPQKGVIRVLVDQRPVELRVFLMPGTCGEAVTIHVVDPQKLLLSLESLGFTIENLQDYRDVIRSPSGLVLIAGPNGSGKQTTLYATLAERNTEQVKICTVEERLTGNIPGVNQFEVNAAVDHSAAQCLHNVLQQSPDVVMVSDIRDAQTASACVQAALAGSLVFSSLQRPDTITTVARLLDFNIEPYFIHDALIAVLAQQLVRKICPNCKSSYRPAKSVLKMLDALGQEIHTFHRGTGCPTCRHTGFVGRIALHELLILDDDIKACILENPSPGRLRAAAAGQGHPTLLTDGVEKVRAGIITIEEVLNTVPFHRPQE